ncbi:hypothetical protein FACS189472_17770 [Alphaproteobacteria bacterium]|nr:hypothetical protein FACS189472_17770 [Alphaproteobacteria bacterium]
MGSLECDSVKKLRTAKNKKKQPVTNVRDKPRAAAMASAMDLISCMAGTSTSESNSGICTHVKNKKSYIQKRKRDSYIDKACIDKGNRTATTFNIN